MCWTNFLGMFSTIHPRLLRARTLALGETDESPDLPAEPPLTREQQRAMRRSQARGRGATAEPGKGKGRGKGRGRGRGRKKLVEDLDGESLSATEDLPDQSMTAPASRPARAARKPQTPPKTPTGATVSPKAKAKGRAKAKAKAKAKASPRKPRAKKPAAPKATPKKRACKSRDTSGNEAPQAKRGRNGKKTAPASPVPMDQRNDLKKLFSPIVLSAFCSVFNVYSGIQWCSLCLSWCVVYFGSEIWHAVLYIILVCKHMTRVLSACCILGYLWTLASTNLKPTGVDAMWGFVA